MFATLFLHSYFGFHTGLLWSSIYIDAKGFSFTIGLVHLTVACFSTLETRGNKSTALLAMRILLAMEQMPKMMKAGDTSILEQSFYDQIWSWITFS